MEPAAKHFRIERLPDDGEQLNVECRCLNCGFTFACDLRTVNLEARLDEHIASCLKKESAGASA
jgi:hypothetical protein